MKRDWGLIRRVLLEIEATDSVEISNYDERLLIGHVRLMNEEDLIVGLIAVDQAQGSLVLQQTAGQIRLTSKGHNLLDAIRDESVWNKTKAKLKEVGGGVAMAILITLAQELVKTKLGLSGLAD